MPSPDQYWSILINVDQDFSLPKFQTLFQNNYYAESWSILINIDRYRSILINMINIDQYRSILINIDQDFFYQSLRLCFKTTIMPSPDQYWSILIKIDQYWSGIFFTKVSDSVSKQLLLRFMINIDLYWSILINILIRTFLYKSLRLWFKTTFMPSPDQYWSKLINIDQYWSILIDNDQYW